MASSPVTLLDIPTKSPTTAWSLNPWRTRLLLNYKGIDYKTEWVEFPHIQERVKDHVSPNEEGQPYTIPTVILPDGTYVMNSAKIVREIEKLYPQRPVNVETEYIPKVEAIVKGFMGAMLGYIILRLPKGLLNEVAHPYWRETREKWIGMSLEQFEKEKGGEEAWGVAEPVIKQATALLEENKDGPFFMGSTISHADFVWGGLLLMVKRMGPEYMEKMMKVTGNPKVHQDLLEALAPYSERNTH